MRTTVKQLAKLVDQLGRKRDKLHSLLFECNVMASAIKAVGGGEGKHYIASLVKMPRKVMVVKAHTQVRTHKKETKSG